MLADFPFVKRVRAAAPGRSAARNKGAAVAGGELLAFLDSEVLPGPDWVEQAVTGLATHGGGCIVASTPEARLPKGGSAAVSYYESVRFHRAKDAAPVPTRVGDGVLMSRTVWRDVGPFDESSPTNVSEYAWLARSTHQGFPVERCPAGVRRTLGGSWDQLTSSVRGQVRSEVAVAQLLDHDPLRTRAERWAAYTKRLASETSRDALRDADVPAQARWGVRAAAAWAWLVRLDESLPDRRLPTSVRRRSRPPGPTP